MPRQPPADTLKPWQPSDVVLDDKLTDKQAAALQAAWQYKVLPQLRKVLCK